MSEHHGSVIVNAPVHQVYTLFTHFNDFPKFMSFIKEVTYYDEERSHWVAQVGGTHEWDAINEAWVPDQQIGWRSINGLSNSGRIKFTPSGEQRTQVDVYITYVPPVGVLGAVVDRLGFDNRFDEVLQQDLKNFAQMVAQAPAGALDPMQSHYLFHRDSAVARGSVTDRQEEAMRHDPMMSDEALQSRETILERETQQTRKAEQERAAAYERSRAEQQRIAQEQQTALRQQAERDRLLEQEKQQAINPPTTEPHPVYDTIGGRNAAMERASIGDQDARSERFPNHQVDPMMSRDPRHVPSGEEPHVADIELESPWDIAIHGREERPPIKDTTEQHPKAEHGSEPF